MSTSNYYSIYINKVLQLAETLVIKSAASAEALNLFVTERYGKDAVDTLRPQTWKYYLNISGEYHFTDELMYVVSSDTLEKVIFSKENLALHRATARAYAYGTRQYKELVTQYPQQEMLILGILYPVDINAAIAAGDGTILGYPKELVEENEYSLIANLQKWVDGFKTRWTNQQYGISDELYHATTLGVMYLNLVPAILTLRLQACKTNEAHSFHVRQYLGSHGMLDAYMDHLTKRQALFLYRNIAYIERNNGQQNVFEWLIEHIMSERNIPIAEYTMRHDLTKQPEEIYPELRFRKHQLNLGWDADPLEVFTLEQMLEKEDPLARDNPLYKDEHLSTIKETMENSLSNVVLTKVLESSMYDYSNSSPYTLEDTLVNHWLYLASIGRYNAYIGVNNPRTGERIPLTVRDAYTFMWYAFCKSIGIVLDEIPPLFAKRVQRIPLPSIDELWSLVDHKLVPRDRAAEALSFQPEIVNVISTEAFYNKCVEINTAANIQRNIVSFEEHMVSRAMVHSMVSRIYADTICRTEAPGKRYGAWFAERNIKVEDFNTEDLNRMYLDLVREATGLSLTTTNSLKALQAAMVRLLTQLSSYSVQFITQINSTDIRMTDWTAVRLGDALSETSGYYQHPDLNSRVLRTRGKAKQELAFDVDVAEVLNMSMPRYDAIAFLEIRAKVQECRSKDIWLANMYGATVGILGMEFRELPPEETVATPLPDAMTDRYLDTITKLPPQE